MAKISFFGGAQTVTGACHLLEDDSTKILVDCGLFQGSRFNEKKNYDDFPFDPKTIDALFVTHAHMDHTGRIPKLVKDGFNGVIYSTPPTKDFASVMLEDSLGILTKEAESRGEKVFYAKSDIEKTLSLWKTIEYKELVTTGDFKVRLLNAGHILGSAMPEVSFEDKKILFTGDLGNTPNPLLPPPLKVKGLTHLIIESAYGDRNHEDLKQAAPTIERAVEDIVHNGGALIMPSFALERTQAVLFKLNDLVEKGRVPELPIFVDSPLAIKATAIYKKYPRFYSAKARAILKTGDDLFRFPNLHFTKLTRESKSINGVQNPKMIIAGAGMMQGGRILHHAVRYLPDPNSTIIFIGYQAAGSLGRRLVEGERSIKMMGKNISVNADVRIIHGYSAHADHDALLDFTDSSRETLKQVFVVQGEPRATMFLAQRIKDYLGIRAKAPAFGETITL
ncbi:MBL fold metallo-hydrolase [Patescibacteria group bacterium]